MKNLKKNKPGAVVIGGHVQGLEITRSLGENNIPVIVVDADNCIARYSKYCKRFFKCPNYLSEDFIEFLVDICIKYNLNDWILYPTNDFISYNVSKNLKQLEKYYKLITPPFETLTHFYNKEKTVELAASTLVGYPKSWFPQEPALNNFNLSFPVLVRGIEGLQFYKIFGKKVFIAFNENQLTKCLQLLYKNLNSNMVLVQEFIDFNPQMRGVYFTSFCIEGKIKTYFIWQKIREHPLRHGTSTFCISVKNNSIYDLSKRVLEQSAYTGVSEIEYLLDPRDGEYKIIEINARTFLQLSLARACGVDYPLIIYNHLHNIPQEYPVDYLSNVKWVHLWTDFYFGLEGLFKREHSFNEILSSYKGEKIYGVLSFKDIKPFILETLMLPYLAKVR